MTYDQWKTDPEFGQGPNKAEEQHDEDLRIKHNNAVRARWAAKALKRFARASDVDFFEEPEETVADLLCDLRHYCDVHGLSFMELDERGSQHHLAETQDSEGVRLEGKEEKPHRREPIITDDGEVF